MEVRGSGSASSLPAPDGSQHALRKAGEEFFEQFLEQARKGRNPLDAAPRTKQKSDVEVGDAEDLETVGRILPYIFGVLLFASAAARLVMAKRAVEALSTPGVHCFLHLLPSLCLCAAFTDIGPLNGRALQACSVQILSFGLQTISLFGALKFCSLYLVLSWTALAPPALAYNRKMTRPQGSRPGLLNALFIAVGISGSALVLLKQVWPSLLGSLCLLGWTVAEGLKLLWEEFKEDSGEAFSSVLGPGMRKRLQEVAGREKDHAPGADAFFTATFSAVPALLLGFLCREGSVLVDHELSVPAVSSILLSCTAWAVCTVTSCLYFGQTSGRARQRLLAFTAVPALLLHVLLNGVGQPLSLVATTLAVAGGVGAQQCR